MRDDLQATEFANRCLDDLQTVNSMNARSAVVAYRVLGIERMNAGEIQEAQKYLMLSLQIILKYFPRNFRLMIQAYTDLAVIFSRDESVKESLRYVKCALAFMKKYCSEDYELYTETFKVLNGVNDRVFDRFLEISETSSASLNLMIDNCNTLSKCYSKMGRLKEAEEVLRKAAEAPLQYEEGSDLADTFHSLSMLEKELGNLSDAERFVITARNIYQKSDGENHNRVAKCNVDLAEIYFSMGNLTECLSFLTEFEIEPDMNSIIYWRKCSLEMTLNILLEKLEETEQIAAEIQRAFDQSLLFATSELCNSLAFFFASKYQLKDSEEYTRKALKGLKKDLTSDSISTALFNCNLSYLLLQRRETEEAESSAWKCINTLVSADRRTHPCLATAYSCLSLIYLEKGERQKSWEMAEKFVECKGQENGEFCPDVSIFLQFLPTSFSSENFLNSPDFNSYGELRNKLMSAQNVWGVWNRVLISFFLLQFGKVEDAAYLLNESPTLTTGIFPSNSIIYAALLHNYACCLLELQQYDYALKSAESSLSISEEMKNNGGKTGTYYVLAVIHHLNGESTVAAYFADMYVDAAEVLLGSVKQTLARIFEAAGENEKAENLRQ